MENEKLAAALEYLKLGLHPIPIHEVQKKPLIRWKPFQGRAPTENEIRKWWEEFPAANIALITGARTGINVIDLDPGAEWPANGNELPKWCVISTPRGGRHYYFRNIDGTRNSESALAPNVDVRADGGFIIAPPSSRNGKKYELLKGSFQEIGHAPDWLVKELLEIENSRGRKAKDIQGGPNLIEETIPKGKRNSTLASLAGSMRRRGMSENEILAALVVVNERCVPKLEADQVAGIAQSIANYPPANQDFHYTDTGNAERLVSAYGKDLKYCPKFKNWFIWDGSRWVEDNKLRINQIAKQTVISMYQGATLAKNDGNRKALAEHAVKSESSEAHKRMINLARSEKGVPIDPSEFDSNHWLLNLENGTLDLRTGEFRENRREELITKLVPFNYDEKASCPIWMKFLDRVMEGNENKIGFLRRAAGYSLTGNVMERVFFILIGTTGANGKSTFLYPLSEILTDYSVEAPARTLIAVGNKKWEGIPNDIAMLYGKRLVTTTETEKGAKLKAAFIKSAAGGVDKITGRFLRKEWFDFIPTHKVWMCTNYLPEVSSHDQALWDRIKVIEFNVRIPEEERDLKLHEKLKMELPGILNWAVAGCLEWQEGGLGVPEEVKEATSAYRADMDVMGAFIRDCCLQKAGLLVVFAELYKKYEEWCRDTGELAVIKKDFSKQLQQCGFEVRKKYGKFQAFGIGLLTDDDSSYRGD